MGRVPGAQLSGASLDLGRCFWVVAREKTRDLEVPRKWYRLWTRAWTVYSKREEHEPSGGIEALVGVGVGVVWANQRSHRHFYVFLRSVGVSPNEILTGGWWKSVLGEGLAVTRTLRFSPKGACSYSAGINWVLPPDP